MAMTATLLDLRLHHPYGAVDPKPLEGFEDCDSVRLVIRNNDWVKARVRRGPSAAWYIIKEVDGKWRPDFMIRRISVHEQ